MKTKQLANKVFTLVLAFVFFLANSGFAQMIVTDGRTDTTVTQNGNTYDISTDTVSGNTGFNSFSKFDVYENATANMYLPEGTQNLVNLVNGPQSNINGVLNAYKNGQIGGNVFFLNPNGIMIGASGLVNVGTLTLMTPTREFMQKVLNEDKTASHMATQAILAGDLPIDSRGLISVKGKIKAVGGVGMLGGSIRNDGQIITNFNTSDIVNTAQVKESGVFVKDGQIIIKAQEDFVNTGVISANSIGEVNGADIDVQAKNIALQGGTISSNAEKGKGGKITVFAQDKATFEKGASLSATSRDNDGGFIELSAKNEVGLNGGTFAAAGGAGKKNGKIFIDPENLIISESVMTDGADYEAIANNKLIVSQNVSIKTSKKGEGHSGHISLSAAEISLMDGVILDASVNDKNASIGYQAGDITLQAISEAEDFSGVAFSKVSIGKNAVLKGKNVTISAEASVENPFGEEENLEELREKIAYKILKELSDDTIKVIYLDTSAVAQVDIASGVQISADETISISSTANVESEVELENANVAAVVVLSDTQSSITIAENAVLDAKADIEISATAENKISLEIEAVSEKKKDESDDDKNGDSNNSGDTGNDSGNDTKTTTSGTEDKEEDEEEGGDNIGISLAYGKLTGETNIYVANGAQLTAAGDISLSAETTLGNELGASTESKDQSFAGLAVAIGLSEVENNILIDGNITASNVEVVSSLTSEGLEIGAESGLGNEKKEDDDNAENNNNNDGSGEGNSGDNSAPPAGDNTGDDSAPSAGDNSRDNSAPSAGDNTGDNSAPASDMDLNVKTDNLESNIENQQSNDKSGVKFGLGGAVTWIDYDNKATAKVGSHANITTTDDVTVLASVSHEGIRQSAGVSINTYKENSIENALAAAVNVGNHKGTAIAGIEDGATVNLGGALNVNASYEVPYEASWWEVFETKDPEKIYKDLKKKWEDDNKGLQEGFVSVFSQSGISDDDGGSEEHQDTNVGIAGTVHVTNWTQDVNAYIGAAHINQDVQTSDSQKVNVNASSAVQLVSLGGMWSLGLGGNVDGDKGLGGSYIQNKYDSNVKAEIRDGAKINTSALSVISELDQIDVTIGLANAESKTFGFEGVFNWLAADNDVKANISKEADVVVRGDNDEDKLTVSATDNSNFINIAGSVLRGENTGVGASVAVTDLTKNTHAYIGDDITAAKSAAGGSLQVDTDAEVQATNEGNVIGLTLAGAVSSAANKQDAQNTQGGNGQYGIGISGDVVYSNVDSNALAYANNAAYSGQGNVAFNAQDHHSIYNVAGSLGIGMGSDKTSVGIAGAATAATITNGTVAEILNSTFDQTGDIDVNANSYSNVVTAAASGSGATGQGVNVAVAGSVSVNLFDSNIQSAVVDSAVEADNLAVNANNDSKITAVSGAVEYSSGDNSVGVGASVTHNDIDNTTKAFVQDSVITLTEKAALAAQDTSRIIAVAGTAGASTGMLAAEASFSINEISNDVVSYTEGSTIVTPADIDILAANTSTLVGVAGQLSYAGKVAVGGSAATSKIRNNTKAYAQDSQMDAKNIRIESDSATDITTSAAGVSASKGEAAVAGSVAVNDIDTQTSAFTKASTLHATDTIALLADVQNKIAFYGGVLAGSGSVGVGATVAVNSLTDRAYAYVQDSTLDAQGNSGLVLKGKEVKGLAVNAYLDDSLSEIIINGAFGRDMAGVAGTVDVSNIGNEAKAYIANSHVNTDPAYTAADEQQVDVYAENKIASEIYGGSLGGTTGAAGVGAVSETIKIENETYAGIKENSIVNAKKSVEVKTSSTEDYDSILVSGAVSGQVAVAGAVNVALLQSTHKAEINQSDVASENVTVKAEDESNLGKNNSVSVGSVGIGAGVTGVGGSVLVTKNTNETTAQIVSSEVDAEKDLKVEAVSHSNLKGYLPTGGAGYYAGVAASVAVNTVNTQANALVSDSHINHASFDTAGEDQNVEISATSDTELENVVASVGGALVGVGAAVSVNNIHNSAQAAIVNGSDVKSAGDVTVEAKSAKNASSEVVALGVGGVGLSGSVSVLNIGGIIDEEALSHISEAANVSNTELMRNKSFSADNLGNSGYFADAVDIIHANADTDVSEELSSSLTRAQGTFAFVEDSVVGSTGTTTVNAEDIITYNNISGGVAAGGATAVGASVATANIASHAKSFLGDNSRIISGKDIAIHSLSQIDSSKQVSIIGSVSSNVGLNAVVAVADEETDAETYVGQNAEMSAEKDIHLTSKIASNSQSQTVGVAGGMMAAAGTSVSKIIKGGTSEVLLADNSKILQGNTTAMASSDSYNYAEAEAGAGGIMAGNGSVAIVENNDKLSAKTGKNVHVAGQNFTLATEGKTAAETKNIGVSLGEMTVGVGVGETHINLDNKVELGENTQINVTDSVNIYAKQNETHAHSEATGVSGALIGGLGIDITNRINGNVLANMKDGVRVNSDELIVGSHLKSDQQSNADFISATVAGAGANSVEIYNDASAITQLGNGLHLQSELLSLAALSDNMLFAKVESGSGGLLDVAVGSALTQSDHSTKLLVGTAGADQANTILANKLILSAQHNNVQDSAVDMISVGGVTGGGMNNTNNSTQNAVIDIEGINNIETQSTTVQALNTFKKNLVTDQNMYYRGGGGVQINAGNSITDVKNNTDIIFGDNTRLLAKDREAQSGITVNAFNDIQAKDYIKLNAGALIEAPVLTTKINNTGHADITLNKASLISYSNSVFNAKTDLDLQATDNMSIFGVAGIAHGVSEVNSTNNHTLTLNDGAEIYALRDLRIGLTQPENILNTLGDASDLRSRVTLSARTQIWNNTNYPVSLDSYASVNHKTTDLVNVSNGAVLKGGKNVQIKTGTPIEQSTGVFDYISYLGAVAASNKTANVNSTYYSKVNNDGQILAGVGNRQNITIRTLDDGSIDVSVSDPEGLVSYKETDENLVNNLISEIEKYQKLKQQYGASDSLALGYQAEIDRLMQELRDLQMVEIVIDPNTGEPVEFIRKVTDVKFITFDDLTANHGDIYISAMDLNGKGVLDARGSSVLSINNESDRFLRLNDVKINDDATGAILYNSFFVATPEDIRNINLFDKEVDFAAENVKSDHGKNMVSELTIASTYKNGTLGINTELNGDIENLSGKVKISTTGSLYSKGNIRARSINLSASKDVVQYLLEGFRHLGGDPSKQWSSVADAHEQIKNNADTNETPEEQNISKIIGNNIFISGRYLNLNGLVQSGTADYKLYIPGDDLVLQDFANVALAEADYAQKSQSLWEVSPLYKLADTYGSIDAYYNVLTGKIEVNDVTVEGGHMELLGHILNTSTKGSGELRVLDGYGQVDIVNNSKYDIVVNNFDTSRKIDGYLKITDLAKVDPSGQALVTIYQRENGSIKEVNSMTRDADGNPNNVVSEDSSVYNPLVGQRYKWMTGQETLNRTTYKKEESSFWGITYEDLSKYHTIVENLDPTPLLEGSLLVLDDKDNTHQYSYTYQDISLGEPVTVKDNMWTTSSGWWIFSTKTYHHELVTEQGHKNYNTHSVRADNPIKINFSGYDNGNISIVSNNSNVLLHGTLNNPTGNILISTINNNIENIGMGTLIAKDINLTAKGNIGHNNSIITDLYGGAVNALSQKGNIELRNVSDEFVIGQISAAKGDVSLSASGNIVNQDANSLITSSDLTLNSSEGVGLEGNGLNISVARLFANTVNDINLTQTGQDLGIGYIKSEKGNLNLTASGSVYADPEEVLVDTRSIEDRRKEWNEMDLFGEAGWTEDQLAYAVNCSGHTDGYDYNENDSIAIPSVIANKITITSGGSVGARLQKSVIDISDAKTLTDEEKRIILAAQNKHIHANQQENTITIDNNRPIVLDAGTVNIEAQDGIYLRQTAYNLKSDYIHNQRSGEVRLEVPTSNIEIKDLQIADGGFRVAFGKEWHSLAYLFNKDIKAMTINPISAVMPQLSQISRSQRTIENDFDSIVLPDYKMDNIVRTMDNLQESAKM